MPDNNEKNSAPGDKASRRPESDRPLGKLSDFRGNTGTTDATSRDTEAQRPPEPFKPEPPEQDRPDKKWSRPETPQKYTYSDSEQDPVNTQTPAGSHHRAGTGMYWAAALIALALLTLFFNNRMENKQRNEGITEKLLQQADGHYYARGKINNQPVLFIVDTGASVVSIPAKLADSMGLPRLEPMQVNTANGEVTVFNTRPVTIQLGDIQLYDVEAHINPGMDPPGVLLGMSFLRRLDFRQRDTRLILKTRPEL